MVAVLTSREARQDRNLTEGSASTPECSEGMADGNHPARVAVSIRVCQASVQLALSASTT